MRATRQNHQLCLAFTPSTTSEARPAGVEGTEARTAGTGSKGPASATRLMEEVCERENLKQALRRVRANKGSPGIDGMTPEQLPGHLRTHWPTWRAQLLNGTYRPQPVKRVEIPKPTGGVRPLGVPTVLDRFIQQAVLQVLQRDWDATFSAHSYGFRPHRSAHQAVAQAQRYIAEGYGWVVDLDLEKFFDRVNHDLLMGTVAKRVADTRLCRLIRAFLNAGVMAQGLVSPTDEGTPQGGPLSPRTQKVTFSSTASSKAGGRSPCLICAVSSTMFMSRDASDEGGQGAPVKCRVSPAGPADVGRRCRQAPRRYPCAVTTASVPLPSGSRGIACSGSRGGTDGGDHVEATGVHCARVAPPGAAPGDYHRATRDRGARRPARRRSSTTWLSRAPVAARCRSNSNMRSIVSGATNSHTRTSCWCRRETAHSRRL